METLNLDPHQLRAGDYLPEFAATVTRVADRRETTQAQAVEVWLNEDRAPLGFLPSYPYKIEVQR